jgi:hypothetical protein
MYVYDYCIIYKSVSCTQDHKWRQYLILLVMYGKSKKKKNFPPNYTMQAKRINRSVAPLILNLVPKLGWQLQSCNCFTPTEMACKKISYARRIHSSLICSISFDQPMSLYCEAHVYTVYTHICVCLYTHTWLHIGSRWITGATK